MKKSLFIIICILISCNLFASVKIPVPRLSYEKIDGTTTYVQVQNKDSALTTRIAEYPTDSTEFSYHVDYSTTAAAEFWAVVVSTDNWLTAWQAADK